MRLGLTAAAALAAFCSIAQAQQVTECSEFEQLVLNNRIDRMSHPSMQKDKCIAQAEIMKAHGAMGFNKNELCLQHMQNALDTINGNTPAGLEAPSGCPIPK